MMKSLTDWLSDCELKFGHYEISILALIKSVLLIILLFWIARFIVKKIEYSLRTTKTLNAFQKNILLKIIKFFFITLVVIIALNTLGLDLTALAVFGGAFGVSIGVGLQKIFSNLISGLVLLVDKSVKPGDLISVANTVGYVNYIGARCVSVIARDGKQHFIPNELFITNAVENWSHFSKNMHVAIPISVPRHVDRDLVKNTLINYSLNNPAISTTPKPTCIIKNFDSTKIEMEFDFWIKDAITYDPRHSSQRNL